MDRLADTSKANSDASRLPIRRQFLAVVASSVLLLVGTALARDASMQLSFLFVTIALLTLQRRIRSILTSGLSTTSVATSATDGDSLSDGRSAVDDSVARGGERRRSEEPVGPDVSKEDGPDSLTPGEPTSPSDEAPARGKTPASRGRKRRVRTRSSERATAAWVQVSPGRYVRVEEEPRTDNESEASSDLDVGSTTAPSSVRAVSDAENTVEGLLDESSSAPTEAIHNAV